MKLGELFKELSVGELSNLAMSKDGSGTIVDKHHTKLIVYLNTALLEIYTRFPLITKELLIAQTEHITNYHLKRQFALSSNSDQPHKYIIDINGEPYDGICLRIMSVSDLLGGFIPLNDESDSRSYFTPQPNILQIPYPINGNVTSVTYQTNHPVILSEGITDGWDKLDQDIEIPLFLKGALIHHIAYSVYSHMNGQEQQIKAQEYITLFEDKCSKVEDGDLANATVSTSHSKLLDRGFV